MTTISGNPHNIAQWREVAKQNQSSSKGMDDRAAFFKPSPPQVHDKVPFKQMPGTQERDKSDIAIPDKKDNLAIGLPYESLPDLEVTLPYDSVPELQLTLPYESIPDLKIGLPYDPFPGQNVVTLRTSIADLYTASQRGSLPIAEHSASDKEATMSGAYLAAEAAPKLTRELAAQMIEKKEVDRRHPGD